MKVSRIFIENYRCFAEKKYRIILNQGGSSSTKTYSLLQMSKRIAEVSEKRRLISVLGPTLPHLRKGAMRDFINILESDNQYNDSMFNKSTYTFNIGNSQIEFFSSDSPEKVRGPRRDILIVNELNLIKKETFEQALIRTKEVCFADFNPVRRFYAHDDLMTRDDCTMIKSTFKDNPFLDVNIVRELLQRKKNPNWWRVYGEGEIGEVEGLVYDKYDVINEIPNGALLLGYGLDFGYSAQTALVELYSWHGKIIANELLYKSGLISKEMIDEFKRLGVLRNKKIICDSEDPRMIKEIKNAGYMAIGIKKPRVKQRIDNVKGYDMLVTSTSLNFIKELQNYMWDEYEGKFIDEPVKEFDHLMDAFGYAVWHLLNKGGLFMY